MVSATATAALAMCLGVGLWAQHTQESAAQPSDKARITSFSFQLLDGTTGYGVPGTVRFGRTQLPAERCRWSPTAPEPPEVPLEERKTDAFGKLQLQVPPGCYAVAVGALGYKPFNPGYLLIEEHNPGLSYSLDRIQKPEGIQRAEAAVRPGIAIHIGYVADNATLQPVAGAEVRERLVGVQARTDAHGFYMLEIPTKSAPNDGCWDILDSISVKTAGYKEEIRKNVEVSRDEVSGTNFGLERGTGTTETGGENSPEPAASAAESDEMAKWWKEPPTRARALRDEWKARVPAIEKLLREQKVECDDDRYGVGIVSAAKLLNGPEVALVDYCQMGAYTDSILVVQLEKEKPVLSLSDDGDSLGFTQGASVMHELGVELVPEKNAIFSVGSDNDGCHVLDCWAMAYVWSQATNSFRNDTTLSRVGRQSYCRYVQQGLAREVENDRPAKSQAK